LAVDLPHGPVAGLALAFLAKEEVVPGASAAEEGGKLVFAQDKETEPPRRSPKMQPPEIP